MSSHSDEMCIDKLSVDDGVEARVAIFGSEVSPTWKGVVTFARADLGLLASMCVRSLGAIPSIELVGCSLHV